MFSWECRTWARPMLKSSLLKYLSHEGPLTGIQGHSLSVSVKDIHGGWIHLMRKWHSDLTIAKLLMNALEKTLSVAGFDATLANELTRETREELCILEDLQRLFSEETTDFELKLSIISLFSRVLELGKTIPEADYHKWRGEFMIMLLSFLANNGEMGNVAELCFRLLNQTLKDQDEKPKQMLMADENQDLMLNICERHAKTGKIIFSCKYVSYTY